MDLYINIFTGEVVEAYGLAHAMQQLNEWDYRVVWLLEDYEALEDFFED